MDLISDLLPQEAGLPEKYDQISGWLRRMGYEVRHQAGTADDRDWEVTFICGGPPKPAGASIPFWTYHSDTRHGLAKMLVRNVTPHLGW